MNFQKIEKAKCKKEDQKWLKLNTFCLTKLLTNPVATESLVYNVLCLKISAFLLKLFGYGGHLKSKYENGDLISSKNFLKFHLHDFHFHWVLFWNSLSLEAANWPSVFAFLSFFNTKQIEPIFSLQTQTVSKQYSVEVKIMELKL